MERGAGSVELVAARGIARQDAGSRAGTALCCAALRCDW